MRPKTRNKMKEFLEFIGDICESELEQVIEDIRTARKRMWEGKSVDEIHKELMKNDRKQ